MAERHLQVAALIDMNMDVLSVTMATAAGGVQDAAPARFLFNSRLMSRRRYIFFFSLLFFLFHVEQEMTDNTDLRKKKITGEVNKELHGFTSTTASELSV